MKLRHWLPVLGLAITAPGAFAQSGPDTLTVVRDAVTGKLRAPTAEEAQELAAQRPAASAALRGKATARSASAVASPDTPLLRSHRGGAASVRVTEEFANHAVVARDADGKLHQQCVSAKDAANPAIDHTGHNHAATE